MWSQTWGATEFQEWVTDEAQAGGVTASRMQSPERIQSAFNAFDSNKDAAISKQVILPEQATCFARGM